MTKKALLFINGTPPESFPDLQLYDMICCTDGAFHYLNDLNFPLDQLTFVSGDFDTGTDLIRNVKEQERFSFEIIETPDQNKTDFQKALEILAERGVHQADVLGGSGGEMDHFLGNLHVAQLFSHLLNITFYDAYGRYFFAEKHVVLNDVNGKMISLYPFPVAENIKTTGLKWPLNQETLEVTTRIGTRNEASENCVSITFSAGNLIVFVGK